jgi:hypothetical protein
VRAALRWLKENNPYYNNILIDDSRLATLPEDGVPEEILHLVRQEQDELNIARENDTYVPEDIDNEDDVIGEFTYIVCYLIGLLIISRYLSTTSRRYDSNSFTIPRAARRGPNQPIGKLAVNMGTR